MRDKILRAMAKILELDEEDFIKQLGASPQAYARFNYYPPCPRPELVLGIKAHSDGPVLTVLLVDREVGGLQVQRENTWFNVPSVPHTLVINLGDSLEVGNYWDTKLLRVSWISVVIKFPKKKKRMDETDVYSASWILVLNLAGKF